MALKRMKSMENKIRQIQKSQSRNSNFGTQSRTSFIEK